MSRRALRIAWLLTALLAACVIPYRLHQIANGEWPQPPAEQPDHR